MMEVLRVMGIRWVAFRVAYGLQRKTGLLRLRTPLRSWPQGVSHKLASLKLPEVVNGSPDAAIATANRILGGELRYFSRHWLRTGFPPAWFRNPFTDSASAPHHQHWTRISDSGETDIKILWEPSRFAFAFPLAAAFAATQDERYAEGFWAAVVDWRERNPPNRGPNWMCGQEVAIRMLAWVHAAGLLRQAQASTPERLDMLAQMIAASAARISANIGYAVRQRNNHGVSEATGLFTAGVVLDEHPWRSRGARLLEKLGRTLIYDDGSFSQHSVNYHRVMLDNYRWAMALADANSISFSSHLHQRVDRARQWMVAMTDDMSGRAPNLGGNDGAWVLPDPGRDYQDYRSCIPA